MCHDGEARREQELPDNDVDPNYAALRSYDHRLSHLSTIMPSVPIVVGGAQSGERQQRCWCCWYDLLLTASRNVNRLCRKRAN